MCKASAAREDLSEWIEAVEDPRTKHYLNDRVIKQMDFYSKRSESNKKKYSFWMTLSIINSLLIPVLSIFADVNLFMKAVIAFLGGTTAAIMAYLRLHNYLELWSIYRSHKEYVYSILYSYFTEAGIFRNLADQSERDTLLIETCEDCFRLENRQWMAVIRTDDERSS